MTFSSSVATADVFKCTDILSAVLSQHHLLGFEIAQSMGSQRVQHSLATNTFISLHFPAVSLGTLGIKRLPIHGPKILIPHILLYHPQREQGNL